MADKRMFAMKIIDSDPFLDLPISAQALYFHLCMRADDDGFVSSPRRKASSVGASTEDLTALVESGFVLSFDSGVAVISHWRLHNNLRKDRLKPPQYPDLAGQIYLKDGMYSLQMEPDSVTLLGFKSKTMATNDTPMTYQRHTNDTPMTAGGEKKGNERKGNEKKRNEVKGEEGKGNEGTVSPLSLPDTQNDFLFDDEDGGDEEFDTKIKPLHGTLGRGVVMLSEKQIDLLLQELSIEEFDKYVDVVASQIEKGKTYGKTHYQAILDMAYQDRGM